MGGEQSCLPPIDPSQPIFSLFFKRPNRIRIVLADGETIEIIKNACLGVWPEGLNEAYLHNDGSYRIRLPGSPFSLHSSLENAISGKMVAMNILRELYAAGWEFQTSSDLTRYQDYSSWFFRRVTNSRPIPSMICLSMSNTDSLHLISTDHDQSVVNDLLKFAVQKSYYSGIQNERIRVGDCYELKLHGNPWLNSNLSSGIESRKMILEIIRQFHNGGYRFYATANLKGTTDCLFFIKTPAIDTTSEKFGMISLNKNDRLRLIDCPENVIDVSRRSIIEYWANGLQNERNLGNQEYGGTLDWEFQLKGYPWWADGGDTVLTRSFLTNLFNNLLQCGWCIVTALDITRRMNDKAVFVLRSCQFTQSPHFCISLNETDKLRLINAPRDVIRAVRDSIVSNWPMGVNRDNDYYGSYQFKFNGNPWSPYSTNQACLARAMMCRLMATLCNMGWSVVCSADVSAKYHHSDNGPDYPIDMHSWFVVYTGTQQVPAVQYQFHTCTPPPSYDVAVKW